MESMPTSWALNARDGSQPRGEGAGIGKHAEIATSVNNRLPAPRLRAVRPKRPLRGQMGLAERLRATQVWLSEQSRRSRFGSPGTLCAVYR
jgi:hypothetical protein